MSVLQDHMPISGTHTAQAQPVWWGHVLWLFAAALFGWVVSTIFAGLLQLARPLFLPPYVLLTAIFLIGYLRWGKFDLRRHLIRHWRWGVAGALVGGSFVVFSVLQQPRTPMPQGTTFDKSAYGNMDDWLPVGEIQKVALLT